MRKEGCNHSIVVSKPWAAVVWVLQFGLLPEKREVRVESSLDEEEDR